MAAQAAEREQAGRGPISAIGTEFESAEARPAGMRGVMAALGVGSLSPLSSDRATNSGYTAFRQSPLGSGSFTFENPDAARSALFLAALSVVAGIAAALAFLLLAVIVVAAVGG